MATYAITIAGVTKTAQKGSFRITESENAKGTASFEVLDTAGSYRPAAGAEVLITENGTRIFGGNVFRPSERGFTTKTGGNVITTSVECQDFNDLPSGRRINTAIPSGTTIKNALSIYILPFLTIYGVTLHASQATGISLSSNVRYDYEDGALVLDDLAKLAGNWVWRIDYNKVLRLYDPTTQSAPFNIAAGDGNVIGDVTVQTSQEDYKNFLYVKYNDTAVRAYAFLNGAGVTISNGHVVVIGSRTYTFQTVLTDVNGNVAIGASISDSMGNLTAAINLSAGAGTAYATSTTINTQVDAIHDTDSVKVRAITAGAAGNSIGVSTTTPAVWITEGSVATSTLTFGADESLTNVMEVFDVSSTTNPREDVISAATSDFYAALAKGNAELAIRNTLRKTVTYQTTRMGIYPGQTQTITLPRRNLSGTFHITSVTTSDDFTSSVLRTVTAVEGSVVVGNWQDTYQQWNSGSTVTAGGSTIITGGGFSGGGAAGSLAVWDSPTVLKTSLFSESGSVGTVGGQLYAQATTTTARTLIAQAGAFGVSHYVTATPVAGAHVSFASELHGSASGGSPLYKIAGYFAVESGANGDDIYGLNVIAQWDAGHTASNIIGAEIDVANNNSDCGIDQTPWVDGLLIVSGGSKKPHAAIHIYCSASTNKWVKGIEISNNPYETGFEPVSHTGIEVGGPSSVSLIGAGVFRQLANGDDTVLLQRRTNTTPTGFLLRAVDASANTLFAFGITGDLTMPVAGASIEIGSSTSSNTPFFDFHSSNNANDYDSRLIASGGGAGDGLGTLTVNAATFAATRVVASSGARSNSGVTASTASGTPVTLFTAVAGVTAVARYLVRAGLGGLSNDATNYGAYADVEVEGSSARIVANNTSSMTVTLSGMNVQATQSSGSSAAISWVALKIGD